MSRAAMACWVAAAMGAAAPALAGERELAPNGAFEAAGAADANLPAAWTPRVSGRTAVAWPAGEGVGGSRCLRMTADPNEKWGHAYWTSDPIRLTPCMAYRVRFRFRCKGHGVPCFSLGKVKSWRLFKGDTEGRWVEHDEVVVVPPDVTDARFSVNNYNRPGKTMWMDDLSIVELPLSASPLTARLRRARGAVAAVGRNVAPLRLTADQQAELRQMRASLAAVEAGYGRLAKGAATTADFQSIDAGLTGVEKAVGEYLLTVWVPDPNAPPAVARPTSVTRAVEASATPGPDGRARCRLGLMTLADEPLAVRVAVSGDRAARDWPVRVLLSPAGRAGAWGEANRLGTLLLPPGTARLVEVEVAPAKAKPGPYAFHVDIEGLDRTTEPGRVTFNVRIPAAR